MSCRVVFTPSASPEPPSLIINQFSAISWIQVPEVETTTPPKKNRKFGEAKEAKV